MVTKIIDLSNYKLHKALSNEIKSKLFYISDEIINFDIYIGLEYIENITFYMEKDVNIENKLEILIKHDLKSAQIINDKILWQSDKKADCYYDLYEKMKQSEMIHEYSYGFVALSEPLISLMNYIDEKIKKFCVLDLQAVEYLYPTMIDMKTVDKCGYMNNSPHMLFFINQLHNDIDNYVSFKKSYNKNKTINKTFLKNIDYCLPPTMCYHTYRQLEGKKINNSIYTSKGKSFRYENKYANTIERLWDFTIRETVFFGSYAFVSEIKNKIMEFVRNLVNELNLTGFCRNANDPFFMDENAAHNAKFQKKLNSKIELCLNIQTNKTIAVGSINYHDSFFCRNFDIKKDGEGEFVSGCTGFGLERFAYAFICQHGFDINQWPINLIFK